MLIEIVWSFLHKALAMIYLNLQTMSLSGFNGVAALCCHVLMGMKPGDSDLSHCDTLNLDEKYNCQRLKHVKCL